MSGCLAAAHRGLSSEVTENTLAAFQAAAQAGFRAIELDLRVTRDGEVIVLHDAGIERTTHGNGKAADMPYDELRTYRTPHGPIPRLDDVFAAMADWNGLWNLEIKSNAAVEPAIHLLEHHGIPQRAHISSFDPRALALAHELAPAITRALIVAGPVDHEDVALAHDLACTWLNLDHTILREPTIASLRAAGFHLGAWTVNDPARARELARLGIDCVITDRRDVLAALAPQAPRA